MSDVSNDNKLNRILLTSLVVIIIFILILLVVIAAYPTVFAPPATITPTITQTYTATATFTETPSITPTPSITNTPRPTLTPSITPTPTRTSTPTLTPTPTGPPTLTPAAPWKNSSNYLLRDWTAEEADRLILLLNDYPNTLPEAERGSDYSNYNQAFAYAAFAQREALLRFPDAEQATAWRWGLAYNLARMGEDEAGTQYAQVIAEGLNKGKTNLNGLVRWFHQTEPRLKLKLTRLPLLAGYLSAHLLEVEGNGSAFILLLESSRAFQAYSLFSQFDYNQPPTSTTSTPAAPPSLAPIPDLVAFFSDITGDKIPEIIIYQTNPTQYKELALPRIFTLSELPPEELIFDPANSSFEVGMEYQNRWLEVSQIDENNDLAFQTSVFPLCKVNIKIQYHWNGASFTLAKSNFDTKPSDESMPFCHYIVDHAANVWGPAAAIEIMEILLPYWPPPTMDDGKASPLDSLDEWHFRLGVYHALIGDSELAHQYLVKAATSPSLPASRWITPAKNFLMEYQQDQDIYRACTAIETCNASLALQRLIERLPGSEYQSIIEYLWKSGVTLRANGYFDFDGDGQKDIWFTVRHRPTDKLELWILMPYLGNIAGLNLGTMDINKPSLIYYDPENYPNVVILYGTMAIKVERSPKTEQPYVTYPDLPLEYPDRFSEGVDRALQALMAGGNVTSIRQQLLDLKKYPGLLCAKTWSCDTYYYLLGLTSEMLGDKYSAIENYHRLWQDYSKSPYTTMARLKLKDIGIHATFTPTISLTPTVTSTAAFSPQPTAGVTSITTPTQPAGAGTPIAPTSTVTSAGYPGYTEIPTYNPYP